MILIGIDDTDVLDSPGTNQLAKAIVHEVARDWECLHIVRHQLLDDPRVPYTSKNGSASIALRARLGEQFETAAVDELIETCRAVMRSRFVEGSDPGLCVARETPMPVSAFGQQCQRQLMAQTAARSLAAECGLHLEGLGGTEGGVIGALAAVGLAALGDDGRIVQWGEFPDDLSGIQPHESIVSRGIEIRDVVTNRPVLPPFIDVGKHLRPNLRARKPVLFAARPVHCVDDADLPWESVRLL